MGLATLARWLCPDGMAGSHGPIIPWAPGVRLVAGQKAEPMRKMTRHPAFLSSAFKKRRDEDDGSMENRCRFLLEIVGAMMQVWGPNTVGLTRNPIATSDGCAAHADTADTLRSLVTKLNYDPERAVPAASASLRAMRHLSGGYEMKVAMTARKRVQCRAYVRGSAMTGEVSKVQKFL